MLRNPIWLLFLLVCGATFVLSQLKSCEHKPRFIKQAIKPVEAKKQAVIGFFNGITTLPYQAKADTKYLKIVSFGENDSPVPIELFYNYTDGFFEDMLEVFEQRTVEQSMILKNRYELLPDLIKGGGAQLTEALRLNPNMKVMTESIINASTSLQAVYKVNKIVPGGRSVSTDQTYQEHINKASYYLQKSHKLILVAHSQGNLFVNHLYESLSIKKALL